jgi:hypothetical protein
MGALGKFLLAAARLAKQGVKEGDILNQAKKEFGEVSEFMRAKIRKFYKDKDAPSIKNPSKSEGEVIEASFKPGADKRGKIIEESPSQASGIMKTDEASPLMKNIDDVKQNIKGMSENNPKTFRMSEEQRNALGYPNRMIEGIIRTSAREILSKKGIDVSKADPIDTFADIFGVNSLERLEDISDELLSAQDYKQLNSILQKNELYNVTPKSGLNLKQSDEIEELTEFDPTGRKPSAMGGINRIGFKIGTGKKLGIAGIEKGKEAIEKIKKFVNDKLGKDTVNTADELDQPPKTDQQIVSEFEARNPNPKREMTPDEYEDFVEEVGGADQLEAYNFDGTIGDAKRILKEQDDRMKYMYDQYRTGKLDPVAGDKSPARKQFLEQKLDEMEATGDSKLMTREEIEELTFFDSGAEMDKMKDIDISQGMIDLDELNFTKNSKAAKEAIDNASINDEIKRGVADVMSDTSPAGLARSIEIDNLMLKYEGMDRRLAEQIATEINPRKKADIIAMVEQTIEMGNKGMSGDDIIQTFKNTPRTKQANGGLSYLMGM